MGLSSRELGETGRAFIGVLSVKQASCLFMQLFGFERARMVHVCSVRATRSLRMFPIWLHCSLSMVQPKRGPCLI
jgi:hypothetical protein